MSVKAGKKSAKRKFYRKLKFVAKRSLMFLLALAFLDIFLGRVINSGYSVAAVRRAPFAVMDVSEVKTVIPPEETSCPFIYRSATPFFARSPSEEFLYREEEIKIADTETIDAEFIQQALALDETATNVTVDIAAMVQNNLSAAPAYEQSLYEQITRLNSECLRTAAQNDKSYELYEEDLPEGIVSDEFQKRDKRYRVHYRDKSIRDININISRKPYYFGPKPVIAVVIDDMGINQSRTKEISGLRAPLTSSFLTYGVRLGEQVETARKSGHEIMIHVPMEPRRKENLAPDTLLTNMDEGEIKSGLMNMLRKFKGVRGINNHMGSRFTEDRQRMSYVMEILRSENLFFLDSKTSPKSAGRQAAEKYNVPYAHRHVFLDNENDFGYIMRQLELSERLAKKNGYAVVIGHPKSQTVKALKKWLTELEGKNIRLVRLSEIIAVLNPRDFTLQSN